MSWNPEEMERLERAIVEGSRIWITRRGTEYVLLPRSVGTEGSSEVLTATTTLGDDLQFRLDEIEAWEVIN
ncbi:MAG: hypothetical protein M3418_00360 [Gemmatimonadota bacterium]|nr:hypothetical protein [Gemmatimonadota bacterium]